MMFIRINMRLTLFLLCIGVIFILLIWTHCGDIAYYKSKLRPGGALIDKSSSYMEDIDCLINNEYTESCKRDSNEVYLPFSFIHKYFEVYGKTTTHEGVERFEWSHSYGKIYKAKRKYDPHGIFTTFDNYNVEVRDRVKCISATDGVPVSTQWEPHGYYYPTQIAQFGLAHYSKNLTEAEPHRRIIDDGERHLENWIVTKDATMLREYNQYLLTNVMKYSTIYGQPTSQVWLRTNITQDFVLSIDLLLNANSSLTVVLQNKEKKGTFYLHYVTSNVLISSQDEHAYYGIGTDYNWKHLTRDLIVDMQKGWLLQDKPKRKLARNKYRIASIILSGSGEIDNITLSGSEHMSLFYASANWFIKNQNEEGGWPIPVKRKIASGFEELKPGWYSAMSQGHALSVLSRAYYRSNRIEYLVAAKRALKLFQVPSSLGGVATTFMDTYTWYEEYPTQPSSYVLNGFIYALLGLYDLHTIEGKSTSKAKTLYEEGMKSLRTLLPLFDTGSGSVYDLRHFSLGVSPNIARWDYHATHINQLYLLALIDQHAVIANTAKRWEGYMQGKRASHN